MKKLVSLILVLCLVAAFGTFGSQVAFAKQYTIATVVKLTGVAWFDRMNEGVKKFAKDTGVNAFEVGPAKGDAALQVQIIEDLIAKKVDAICVVPDSVEALEPVLKKAMDSGIVVIGHEASNLKNCNYDIEAFDNAAYGAHFMDYLAKLMGYKGQYGAFVGSLTAQSHNEWVNAAVARQKKMYPKMEFVGGKLESFEDQQIAYTKFKDLLTRYPNLKGIEGSAGTDVAGVGMAIEEMGLQGKIHVVGTSLPSQSGRYLRSGAIDMISFWDPALAGYVMNKLALMVLQKKPIKNGMDLGVEGYRHVTLQGKVLRGQAWVDVTKENVDNYRF